MMLYNALPLSSLFLLLFINICENRKGTERKRRLEKQTWLEPVESLLYNNVTNVSSIKISQHSITNFVILIYN